MYRLEDEVRQRKQKENEPSKKMWMAYAEQSWTKATDLRTAVERLTQQFSAMVWDADHEAVYGNGYFSEEQCKTLSEKYTLGLTICENFLSYKYCAECLITRLNGAGLDEFAKELNKWCGEPSTSSSSDENASDDGDEESDNRRIGE
ncbi:hypothetical protein RI129_003248 [Pyrocoelia pectoralis]|uniref:Uncharacterized protein n=1 Tax=Pyrocoelia pectoralis TaxID=417401 RepID=A0AAN7VNK9_9COLE